MLRLAAVSWYLITFFLYVTELTGGHLVAGEDSALQRAATQEQLDNIREFARRTCDAMKSLSSYLLPTKPIPGDSEGLLKRLLKAPVVVLSKVNRVIIWKHRESNKFEL